MPSAKEGQDLRTLSLPSAWYPSFRVLKEMLSADAFFFQADMVEEFHGISSERFVVWVDELIIWGKTPDEVVDNVEFVLGRLERNRDEVDGRISSCAGVGDGGRANAVFASRQLDNESSDPGCSDERAFAVADE